MNEGFAHWESRYTPDYHVLVYARVGDVDTLDLVAKADDS